MGHKGVKTSIIEIDVFSPGLFGVRSHADLV